MDPPLTAGTVLFGLIFTQMNRKRVSHSLCKQDGPLPDHLPFDPYGSCLFAVDPKEVGLIYRTSGNSVRITQKLLYD